MFKINPNYTENKKADIDLIVGATIENIMMVEGEMSEVSEADMLEAIKVAHEAIKEQCKAQLELMELAGKMTRTYEHEVTDEDLKEKIEKETYDKVYAVAKKGSSKQQRSTEFEEIKKHPQMGVDIIRPIHSLQPIIPALLYHHERWDGSGYPRHLKGEQIPLTARIFSIVDVWDAITSERPYHPAMPEAHALEYIRSNSGKHFDPRVVTAFLRLERSL